MIFAFSFPEIVMSEKMNRRNFVKSTVLGASVVTAAGAVAVSRRAAPADEVPNHPWSAGMRSSDGLGNDPLPPVVPKREIPKGTIAGMTISRMILGGNLFTYVAHARDLRYVSNLAAHYNTPKKVHETMRLAEEYGIDTVCIHAGPGVVNSLKEYKRRGGTIQSIVCPTAPIKDDLEDFTESCRLCIDAGVDALYLWGVFGDQLVDAQPELLKRAVNTMRSFGVPVGVAAHNLKVIEFCEQEKLKNDFYLKTFHHRNYPTANLNYDSSWCDDPEKHTEVFSKIEKPWIAYKVMAAGAIPPHDALDYTFTNGADFVVFGMFDYEIDEDTRLFNEVLALDRVKNRTRKWFG